MRGRNRNTKGPNPLTRSYESNGPDVKVRGTPQHVAEKYSQLARDAQASGDPVAAENYYQHAEHYIRIIAAAQEQLREQYGFQPRPFEDEGDEEGGYGNGEDGDYGPQAQPQPYEARPDYRQDQRPDYRGENRPDEYRGDRPRYDRQDGRPDNRPENRQDNRQDNKQDNRRDRFVRGPKPENRDFRSQDGRSDYSRDNRPERNGQDRPQNQDRPYQERNGQDRNYQDRRPPERNGAERPFSAEEPRRERQDDAPAVEAPALPAFLMNPVRPPAPSVGEGPENAASAPLENVAEGVANGDHKPRRRRRRRPFEEGAEPTLGLTPEVETPPAE